MKVRPDARGRGGDRDRNGDGERETEERALLRPTQSSFAGSQRSEDDYHYAEDEDGGVMITIEDTMDGNDKHKIVVVPSWCACCACCWDSGGGQKAQYRVANVVELFIYMAKHIVVWFMPYLVHDVWWNSCIFHWVSVEMEKHAPAEAESDGEKGDGWMSWLQLSTSSSTQSKGKGKTSDEDKSEAEFKDGAPFDKSKQQVYVVYLASQIYNGFADEKVTFFIISLVLFVVAFCVQMYACKTVLAFLRVPSDMSYRRVLFWKKLTSFQDAVFYIQSLVMFILLFRWNSATKEHLSSSTTVEFFYKDVPNKTQNKEINISKESLESLAQSQSKLAITSFIIIFCIGIVITIIQLFFQARLNILGKRIRPKTIPPPRLSSDYQPDSVDGDITDSWSTEYGTVQLNDNGNERGGNQNGIGNGGRNVNINNNFANKGNLNPNSNQNQHQNNSKSIQWKYNQGWQWQVQHWWQHQQSNNRQQQRQVQDQQQRHQQNHGFNLNQYQQQSSKTKNHTQRVRDWNKHNAPHQQQQQNQTQGSSSSSRSPPQNQIQLKLNQSSKEQQQYAPLQLNLPAISQYQSYQEEKLKPDGTPVVDLSEKGTSTGAAYGKSDMDLRWRMMDGGGGFDNYVPPPNSDSEDDNDKQEQEKQEKQNDKKNEDEDIYSNSNANNWQRKKQTPTTTGFSSTKIVDQKQQLSHGVMSGLQ